MCVGKLRISEIITDVYPGIPGCCGLNVLIYSTSVGIQAHRVNSHLTATNSQRFSFRMDGGGPMGNQLTQIPLETTTTTTVLQPFVRTTQVSWFQKKHSPTHHTDHHQTFITFFHLLRSPLHNLSPSPFSSTSWSGALHLILHTILHPITVFFSQHMPILSQPVLLQYEDYIIYS